MGSRLVTVFCAVLFAAVAAAGTINVPADQATIAEAITAASAEDEIVLAVGTHYIDANLQVNKKLTIRGATGNRDDVIVEPAAGKSPNQLFNVTTSAGTVIRDLTIRGAKNNSNGAAVHFGKAGSLINCRITDSWQNGSNLGGLVYGDNNVPVTVKDCLFDHNVSDTSSGSLGLYGSYRAGKISAMVYVQSFDTYIENCTVVSNTVIGWYVKSNVFGLHSLKAGAIRNCEIAYNTAQFIEPYPSEGPWLLQADASTCVCENISIHDNHYWGAPQDPAKIKAYSVADTAATIEEHDNGPLYPESEPAVPTQNVSDVAGLYAALEAAEPWSEIVLATGTYTLTSDLDVQKPVTIRSATGNRDDVTINGNVNKYCVRLWTDGAVLKDLTVTACIGSTWYKMQAPIALFGGGKVENCHVTGNTINAGICGIRNYNGTVIDTLIDGNTARDSYANNSANGNGPYWQYGSLALMDRCVVSGNRAWDVYEGGNGQWLFSAGLFITGGTVRNTQVSGNRMEYKNNVTASTTIAANRKALGIYMTAGSVENCSVIDNVSSGVPQDNVGGITMSGGTVKNTLIWGNGDENGAKVVNWLGDAANYSYCAADDVTDIAEGVPLAAAPYQYEDGLAMPLTGVPIIGTGLVDATWMTDATDLVGNPRLKGDKVSIGATEFVSNMTVTWEAVKYRAYERYSQIVEAGQVTGDTTGLRYLWDLDGDGVFEKTGPKQYLDLTKPGETVVTLKVTNTNGGEATCSHTFTIPTYSNVMFVVKDNPGAAAPYATEETAAARVEDALDIAPDGSKIIVAEGTYPISKVLQLTNEVKIVGATGNRDDVVLDGGDARRVAWIENASAVVEDVTFARGYTVGRATGVYNKGSLRNCRITNCRMYSAGGDDAEKNNSYPHSALHNEGVVTDCLIDGNKLSAMYGNNRQHEAIGVYQSSGLMDRCVVTNNFTGPYSNRGAIPWDLGGGVYQTGGEIRNSLIAWNIVDKLSLYWNSGVHPYASGAVVAGGSFINNTVVGNAITEPESTNLGTFGSVIATGAGVVRNTLIKDNVNIDTGAEYAPLALDTASFANCSTDADCYFFRKGKLRIKASSPCRDAGADEDWMLYATDLNGKPRIYSRHVDIGAVESQSGGLMLMLK